MKAGIYTLSMTEYLALPYLSSGLCNTLLTYSPFHAQFEQTHREPDDTDASDAGTAIHDALLEGIDRIAAIDAKDWRTNAAKEARDAARAAGKIPMLAHKVAAIEATVKAASEYIDSSALSGIFGVGEPEQTVIWQEGELLCKARPDWTTAKYILHVKTTQGSAEPSAWIRNQLAPMGYDVAAAFYERATKREQVFLVIEQNAPHGCSLVGLSPAMNEIAAAKIERAIGLWAQCKVSGKWPCYPTEICYAEPANWQLSEHENSMLTVEELDGGIPA